MKKPEILKLKIQIANLIRNNFKAIEFSKRPQRVYWWKGIYEIGDFKIYIFFQNYVRKIGVDYVDIRHNDTLKQLTKKELLSLYDYIRKVTQVGEGVSLLN